MSRLHMAVEGTWLSDDGPGYEMVACCGNDFRRTKKLTEDWTAVTCPTCRELCGFDVPMTECAGDPMRKGRVA